VNEPSRAREVPSPRTDAGPTCDLLLTGGAVVTMDDARRVLEPGAVAITGDRIVAVGPQQELNAYRAARTIDCRGRAVLPGFVDCHNHLFQTIARGLGEGMALWPWLAELLWPLSINITPAEARAAVSLAAVEAARAGITSVADNHYAPTDLDTTLAIADAIEQVGLRGAVMRGMFGEATAVAREGGLDGALFRYTAREELEITRAALEARRGRRVVIWPTPENVIYNSQALVAGAVALAREFGTSWHTHCSEAPSDPDYYLKHYGMRPVEWLHREGLLGRDATLAHGIFLSDREVELLGATGTGVAYCPVSHQYIALGVMRLRDLRSAGARVGLGVDGLCAHRVDMFEQMKSGILLQRVDAADPLASSAEEALELATREGAASMGLEAGVLAPGMLADIAVVNLRAPHLVPRHRVIATLTYAARAADVQMTIVGGEVIYEGGRCTRVDEDAIMDEAQARADELIARAGMSGLRRPWRSGPARSGA
jgi:5-methylthioadenosine/S-adenosylhomocysteine deaminase